MGLSVVSSEYEEIRKQRLEANQRRLQELGISKLSESLLESGQTITVAKTSKPKVQKEDFPIEVRRSSRVASVPQPDYRENANDIPGLRRGYKREHQLPRRYASDIERIKAADQAKKVQEELEAGYPSFVKLMLHSHVSRGFWLGLPNHFCKENLPAEDDIIALQDERGDEWDAVFIARRTGLSGGWRGFAMDHDLQDGDAVVFELIQPKKFKLHIVRAENMRNDGKNIEKKDTANSKQSKSKETPKRKGSSKLQHRKGSSKVNKGENADLSSKSSKRSSQAGKLKKTKLK